MEASKEKKKVTFAAKAKNKNKVKSGEENEEDFIPIPKTNSCENIWNNFSFENIFKREHRSRFYVSIFSPVIC